MNKLDKQYQELLQSILDYGVEKKDRTGTGTKSIFGYTIRHNMQDGFPVITTKKMAWKTMVTELLWFLRGDSDIRFLWENNCTIWDGDWYKKYKTTCSVPYTLEEVKQKIKNGNHSFHDSMFDMGPIYGKQWRRWENFFYDNPDPDSDGFSHYEVDQITNLINDLKTNPDSRRLMVNDWNVGELDQMVLPPCHYGFEVYTRELSISELNILYNKRRGVGEVDTKYTLGTIVAKDPNIPTRAISLMWNQRSVDTFLGLPFNIASYALLLEIISKEVNMIPDELIGNLGDTHLYSNHIEQAKEQIGRELTWEEQVQWVMKNTDVEMENLYITEEVYKESTPKRTRQPFPLPKLRINTEFWKTESGECGIGLLNTNLKGFEISDFQIENYQSHPAIKAPLSN
jgi:thymidylate synthase